MSKDLAARLAAAITRDHRELEKLKQFCLRLRSGKKKLREVKILFTTRIAFANFHFFFSRARREGEDEEEGKKWARRCDNIIVEATRDPDDKIKFSFTFDKRFRRRKERGGGEEYEMKI